jgi:hypothetical protein
MFTKLEFYYFEIQYFHVTAIFPLVPEIYGTFPPKKMSERLPDILDKV